MKGKRLQCGMAENENRKVFVFFFFPSCGRASAFRKSWLGENRAFLLERGWFMCTQEISLFPDKIPKCFVKDDWWRSGQSCKKQLFIKETRSCQRPLVTSLDAVWDLVVLSLSTHDATWRCHKSCLQLSRNKIRPQVKQSHAGRMFVFPLCLVRSKIMSPALVDGSWQGCLIPPKFPEQGVSRGRGRLSQASPRHSLALACLWSVCGSQGQAEVVSPALAQRLCAGHSAVCSCWPQETRS